MWYYHLLSFITLACFSAQLAAAETLLFTGGTIIGFNQTTEGLEVYRNGTLLLADDRIVGIYPAGQSPPLISHDNFKVINAAGKIITPGFIDTHHHMWQTAFKTLGSNTSLIEYLSRYGEYSSAGKLSPEDVYVGQLAGLYEALNAGVTTILDHAHHTWDNATTDAGLQASIDSRARVFWSFAFHNVTDWTVPQQLPKFREIATQAPFNGTHTSLGIAYDFFGPNPWFPEVDAIAGLAREFNVSVITSHSIQGHWGFTNSPEDLHYLGLLNTSIPIVLSHGSFLTDEGLTLLKSTNQYFSVTPESEMHYGHGYGDGYLAMEQAALGVDTHFTYSTDILSQARLWLQTVRSKLYTNVLNTWRLPANNPMSVDQAFLLATRSGGLALHRPDLGIIAPGATADLILWDAETPSMLGWRDPVAAVILHASVENIVDVLVGGQFVKRRGKLVAPGYNNLKTRFLASAERIQNLWVSTPLPVPPEIFPYSGYPITEALTADTLRGYGTGYGETFLTLQT